VWGGPGDDYCLSVLDAAPDDRLIGGPGIDSGVGDPGDRLRSIENDHVTDACT
jgi:hypothetical protein